MLTKAIVPAVLHHLSVLIMSSYQLIAPLTEVALEDQVCEGTYCDKAIQQGTPFYPAVSFDNRWPLRRMCHDCFEKCLKQLGTTIHTSKCCVAQNLSNTEHIQWSIVQPPEPEVIKADIGASQSGGK